ncbi:DUF2306 domain-containing protein [Dokdonia sinensis]|uniref:DUF2306 domain-containing protein n=1 Tax=Dokdonia sinensis TaxID=2479847 RepID=A0A3M0G5W8_9FLAO|nr:DUF2306 domain-containing protein [Dokdonia sinensis]RMB59487.1 DUF2306 domain-containing protein [Dokdonia sinensis]
MTIDQFFTIFISIHALFGSISLLAGTISVIARKGGRWHKKSGIIFYYGMLVASLSGVVASFIPGHVNPFLFVVGLFSFYLVLSGYRALRFKRIKSQEQLLWDKILSWGMFIVGLGMIFFGVSSIVRGANMGTILIVFGLIAIFNASIDLRAFRDLKMLRKKSIRLHIGKISGAYIASFTAFFVTNNVLPALLSWLLPTVFGVIFITYWLRRTRIPKKTTIRS